MRNKVMVNRLMQAIERLGDGDLAFRWAETVGYVASVKGHRGKAVYSMDRI